ncbi:Down syndrome cell adhesion molecule homolog isoform X2 [Paramuricea clavata]|uniref:Down syndrome cell adhesion molecule homolog isoform X2 n=1 Tax=Paramuricea clavata TaxID=317549 RepID=A0A7D9F182_PARCT|nr:Down syndrome cell adhesion molecule homolog isoform X2 [Paramuricea clavata]
MRIEICGATLFPDKPTNLTFTNIKSRSAEISWINPENTGDGVLTGFWIIIKKENSSILNIITKKVKKYKSDNLSPYTTYEISVAAGNKNGFIEGKTTSFTTSEDGPEGPPLNVTVIAESSSLLSVTWEPPKRDKRNGIIVSYTVCISHEESKPCFREYTTKNKMIVIDNLFASTKYYVRVLASTKVGRGPTVKVKGNLPMEKFICRHFYVLALELKDGQESQSPASYRNNELVTYTEAEKSTDPKPYIAAIVTSKDENMFILGDGGNTSNPTSRRHRSTSSDYYNGPLEPGTSYSIFQRIFIHNKGEYYSTDWSPASKTNEYSGGPRVLTKISSGDIKAKEGELVNLLCSAQGELPITSTWEKDQQPLESLVKIKQPHRSSFLVVTVQDQTSFGKYICLIRDRFKSTTTHTISIQKLKDTGTTAFD